MAVNNEVNTNPCRCNPLILNSKNADAMYKMLAMKLASQGMSNERQYLEIK
jgi:hypothetical protein